MNESGLYKNNFQPFQIENIKLEDLNHTNHRYKSKTQMIGMGIIISISAVIFGYGLTEISTIPIGTLAEIYGITFSHSVAQSILIGIMPVGGIFGAAINQFFIKHFNRKNSLLIICGLMLLSVGLLMITTQYTLIIGRFIQGICVALYVSISPIYLKQIAAKQLRSQISAIFSLGKVFGIVLAYSLEQILKAANFAQPFRILLTFNGYLAIIQAVLMFFLVPHSPVEMVEKKQLEKAKQHILLLYHEKYAEEVMSQYIKDRESELAKSERLRNSRISRTSYISQTGMVDAEYPKKIKRALLMGLNFILIRQFIGGNTLVTFSGPIIAAFDPNAAEYVPLVIDFIQFIFNAIAVLFLAKKFGRRPLGLFGVVSLTILNFIISLLLLFNVGLAAIIFIGIYMAFYGGSLLPIGWSYPSEVIPAQKTTLPNISGWVGLAIVTIVPPLVVGAMPNHNSYPLFFFFGLCGIVSSVIIYLKMVESKGRTYEQIVAKY